MNEDEIKAGDGGKQKAEGAGARYRATEQSYIDDKLVQAGEEVDYAGPPGYNLEPVNDIAKRMAKKYSKAFNDPIEAMTLVS